MCAIIDNLSEYESYLIARDMSKNTIRSYMTSVKEYFSEQNELTQIGFVQYKSNLLKRCLKPSTVNLRISALQRYATYAGINDVDFKRLRTQKAQSVENIINRQEYDILMNALSHDNYRYYEIVKLLACTGCRVSELIMFTGWDLKNGYRDIYSKGKIRRIFIPETICTELIGRHGVGDKPLVTVSARAINLQLQKFAIRYGIRPAVMHCHSFRHFFAVEFLKNNNDISLLADLLGHSSINTTAIYLRLSREEQKQRFDAAVDW